MTFFIIFFTVSNLFSQGKITGRIFDNVSNEGVEFATILVLQSGDGTISETNGEFVIDNVKPGVYDVQISFLGYRDQTFFELEVTGTKPAVI